jgi:hypothetical protein
VTEISVEIQKTKSYFTVLVRMLNARKMKSPNYYFTFNEKEIAPLDKWSLQLPYTLLSVGSPFIEALGGGKMP